MPNLARRIAASAGQQASAGRQDGAGKQMPVRMALNKPEQQKIMFQTNNEIVEIRFIQGAHHERSTS
ncbi:MAG: hypothetical protein WBM09_11425 [Gallionella sp.]